MKKIKTISILILLLTGFALPAYAIPSPDIIINLFGSVSHLFVIGLAYVGGIFLALKQQLFGGLSLKSSRTLVVLLLLLVGSFAVNIFQTVNYRQQEMLRLSKNLTRTSKQGGILVQDVSLKTLGLSDQFTHPRGLSTDDFLGLIKAGKASPIFDVREPEEYQTSYIPGSYNVRYPDLARDHKKYFAGYEKVYVFCESGNRSSELVNLFKEKHGIDNAYFVIGGHEKWHSEHKLAEGTGSTSKIARDVLPYPNKETLLTTDEVQNLYGKGDILFIDTRYDTEFKFTHLPKAFQFPLRRLASEEVEEYLEKIPQGKKIIGVCYDKRSCFYAKIVGHKLHSRGFDYLGRYTVPQEFTIPEDKDQPRVATFSSPRELVQNFFAADKTPQVSTASLPGGWMGSLFYQPLLKVLSFFQEISGSWGVAIILFILLCRLALGPFSFLSDRSSYRMKQLKPMLDQIRKEWKDDPKQRSKEMSRLYREGAVSPALVLVSGIIQLLLFIAVYQILSFLGPDMAGNSFAFFPDLADRDRSFVLPTFCALLILGMPFVNGGKKLPFLIFAPIFFILVMSLQVALLLYLTTNLTLFLIQQALTFFFLRREESPKPKRSWSENGIVFLSECIDVPGVGAKARNLGLLLQSGFRVPQGFVLTSSFFKTEGNNLVIDEAMGRDLLHRLKKLGARKVAVRSSGLGEDGQQRSAAGLFESILDVDETSYLEAIRSVYLSFFSERAGGYQSESIVPGILVQEMIEAEYAGVLFTAHPQRPSQILVEMVSGTGDQLVSGKVKPDSYVFSRDTLESQESKASPVALQSLIRDALKIEKIFGVPQDIEWAYAHGKFYFLQARPITALALTFSSDILVAREKERLLTVARRYNESEAVWKQTELSEILPRPTPFSLSLMRALWSPQGATGIACRKLGLPYAHSVPRYIETLFGWSYVNIFEEKNLIKKSFGPLSAWKMERERRRFEKNFEKFLSSFEPWLAQWKKKDWNKLSTEELWKAGQSLFLTFVTEHYVWAEMVNVLARYSHEVMRSRLEGSPFQVSDLLTQKPRSKMGDATELLAAVARGLVPLEDYLKEFGHRASCDYELAEPRFFETPEKLNGLLVALRHEDSKNHVDCQKESEIKKWSVAQGGISHKLFLENWEYLKRYESLKETAKHYLMKELSLLRQVLLKMSERKQMDLFYLKADEVWGLVQVQTPQLNFWHSLLDYRRAKQEVFASMTLLPPFVGVKELEQLGKQEAFVSGFKTGEIQGLCVSGGKVVEGVARVLERLEDLSQFQPGEILVARFTEPSWAPLFKMAKGIVTEVGGVLSHASILAREYQLTAIVSAQRATEFIKTGDEVILTPEGVVRRKNL